jgi:hypothetical protein
MQYKSLYFLSFMAICFAPLGHFFYPMWLKNVSPAGVRLSTARKKKAEGPRHSGQAAGSASGFGNEGSLERMNFRASNDLEVQQSRPF